MDWAHWGLSSTTSFNHKGGTPQQISNYTRIGSGTVKRYTNNPTAYTWSDGDADAGGNKHANRHLPHRRQQWLSPQRAG
ncbi:MAG: hypothetical protein WKF84_22910 [Pyrinomonadaceae bacterium]